MPEIYSPEISESIPKKVFLIEGETDAIVGTRFEILNEKNQRMGECAINFQEANKDKTVSFTGVGIEDTFRGQGYGKLIYEEAANLAKSKGYIFRSSKTEWPPGKRVWESLAKNGVVKSGREGLFRQKFYKFKDNEK